MIVKDNKLTNIVTSFTPAEYRDFISFTRNDIVTTPIPVKKLIELIELSPFEAEKQLSDKKKIFSHCFPREKYDDKKVRYLLTDITKCAEKFLAFNVLMKKEEVWKNMAAEELSKRGCKKAYESIYASFKKNNPQIQDSDYYYNKYAIEFTHLVNEVAKKERDEESNIEQVIDNLDKFYISQKLKLSCEVMNVKNIMAKNYRAFLLDEIVEYINNNNYFQVPIINAYYLVLMTLTNKNSEQYFSKLRSHLAKREASFSKSELREIYQYLLNYCIKKINIGDSGYQKTLFELYKEQLKNQSILLDNCISQWDYKNIITVAFRLKDYAWAEKFIVEYKPFLKIKERDNAFTYNMSYLYFHKKKFSKTLALLQQVSFTDLYYQLDSKAIILKIYFEENELEAFMYHSAAFKAFLKRNSLVSDYQKIIYNNLIKYSIRIMRAQGRKKRLLEIKAEIERNRQTADLNWLLEKIEEQAIEAV